jgi:glutamyl-tRNA synthetase
MSSAILKIKTRFAPSPTGLMHFGNVRTALFNYLYAKHLGGIFLLRIEDTDIARSELQFRDALLNDLEWLGILWQEGPYYQSERQTIYNDFYQHLETSNRAYPCFCSEEQLALTRKVQLASGQPPRYPGTCRQLSAAEIERRKAAGIPFTLRFEVANGQKVQFEDLIKGPHQFETDHIGDFIIRRQDGSASFMFCNAIDDALMEVTHALRGDDHLTNTPRQLLILQALGLKAPQYGHFPTILGPDSRPLSKRNGSRSIKELRESGFLPIGINNYLARLGHYDPDQNLLDLETLSQHFDLKHISHAPAHYDAMQLNHWQKESMHRCTAEECWQRIAEYVEDWVPADKKQLFVETVQPNLVMPVDSLQWAMAIFEEDLVYNDEVGLIIREAGAEFFGMALELLNDPSIHFSNIVQGLQQKTGRKGKAVFFPLRAALTAVLHGPELAKIMELMGLEKVKARLTRSATYAKNL